MEGMYDSKAPMSTAEPTAEIWKPCLQNYEVSNMGRLRRNHDKSAVKTALNLGGYPQCSVVENKGKSKNRRVHRLVALAFLGSPPSKGHSVDHINRKRYDNRLVNLRWATAKQQNHNTRRPQRKLLRVLRKSEEDSKEYDNVMDAAYTLKTDLNLKAKHTSVRTFIVMAINAGKKYQGYRWEYVCEKPKGRIATIPSLPRYAVSECGMIRDLYGRWGKGGVRLAYNVVAVMIDGVSRARFVHRLVAETFCAGQSEQNNVCNHINGCKTDNRSSNLEWTTPSGNAKHASAMGLTRTPVGRKINQYDKDSGVLIKTHVSVKSAAREVSGHSQNLTDCCNGRRLTSKGFKWGWCVDNEEQSEI